MADGNSRPRKLAFIVVPLALLPVAFTWLNASRARGFIVLGAICFCSVACGFWWGEMRGHSGPGRAALGCISTLALFVAYLIFIFGVLRFPFSG